MTLIFIAMCATLWLAMCVFGAWVFDDMRNIDAEYKKALCDRWRDTNWYFHEDAWNDFIDNGGVDDPNN